MTAPRHAILAALRRADAVIAVGDAHGWTRPKSYTDALAMLNAARQAQNAAPPPPAPPAKPKDIPAWVEAATGHRSGQAARAAVLDDLVGAWERTTAEAGLSALPDYATRLVAVFDETLAAFDAHAGAPRTLTGLESDEQISAHTAALRAAGELSATLMQRATLADAAGEGDDIGADIIWLILAPHADTTRDGIQDALSTFAHRIPQTLDEWDALRPLGLRLAAPGDVAARRERHSAFMYAIAMRTPDMGMRDHTYGEIEGNPGAPYGAVRQAEADEMFARAEPHSL